MSGAFRPVEGPLHSAEAWRICVGGSNIQRLTFNLQNLIANEILESPVTPTNHTTAVPSNREKFRGPRINKHASGVTFASEAKKKLIATHPNSKFLLTRSKRAQITFSNRNTKRVSAIAIYDESPTCPESAERVTNHCISNRNKVRIEIGVSHRKQRNATKSNRNSFRGSVKRRDENNWRGGASAKGEERSLDYDPRLPESGGKI
jgi:hypothetical protein